jgi:hypothetical protein
MIDRLRSLPARDLETVLVRGETPAADGLAGWEFRGWNTPAFARLLGIQEFVKGFFRGADGALYGYNRQPGKDKRFGFYRVDAVDAAARDNAYLHALLLDYGRGGGTALDPTTRLRDYLVRVERGSDDLLLGKAFVALGRARVPVSYFLLERLRPTEFRG